MGAYAGLVEPAGLLHETELGRRDARWRGGEYQRVYRTRFLGHTFTLRGLTQLVFLARFERRAQGDRQRLAR